MHATPAALPSNFSLSRSSSLFLSLCCLSTSLQVNQYGKPKLMSVTCLPIRSSVRLSDCPLNKEGNSELNSAHNESQYWQATATRATFWSTGATYKGRGNLSSPQLRESRGIEEGMGRDQRSTKWNETNQVREPQWLTIESAHGQVNYFAYIYYNLWNWSPIGWSSSSSSSSLLQIADRCCYFAMHYCQSTEAGSQTGRLEAAVRQPCTKVVKGLRTIVVNDRPLS